MTSELYRHCTVGDALIDSLDEMIKAGKITPHLALKVVEKYDQSISKVLATNLKSNITFKADRLKTYRYTDNMWVLMFENVRFKGDQEIPDAATMKIVAFDSKLTP